MPPAGIEPTSTVSKTVVVSYGPRRLVGCMVVTLRGGEDVSEESGQYLIQQSPRANSRSAMLSGQDSNLHLYALTARCPTNCATGE